MFLHIKTWLFLTQEKIALGKKAKTAGEALREDMDLSQKRIFETVSEKEGPNPSEEARQAMLRIRRDVIQNYTDRPFIVVKARRSRIRA